MIIYIYVCVLLLGMRLILVHLHVSAQCRWFYPGISPLKWIYVSLKLRDDTSSDYLNMEMMIINLGFPHNCQTHSFSGWPLSKTKQKKIGLVEFTSRNHEW